MRQFKRSQICDVFQPQCVLVLLIVAMAMATTLSTNSYAQTAPINDNFGNAITVSGTSGSSSGTNVGATRETGEPTFGNSSSVWWRWAATGPGTMVFDTIGSSFDSETAVYTGSTIGGLTLVVRDSDSGGNLASRVSFTAVAGGVYSIAVTGFSDRTGSIQLNWQFTAAPSNDNFGNAITLSGNSGAVSGSNVASTRETGEPQFGNAYSVWWRWTAPAAGIAVFDTIGSNFDVETAVYTGSTISGLTLVVRDSDSGGSLASRVSFNAIAGTVYSIAVTGFSDRSGSIRLNWQFTGGPANDNYSSAITISGNSGTTTGSNVAATKETGEPTFGNSFSVWWKWTAPGNGPVVFDTIGSSFDVEMAIYTGSNVGALTLVVRDSDSGGNLASRVSFTAVAGTVYSIAVTGFNERTGSIQLNWQFTGTTTPPTTPGSGTTTTSFTWESWRQRAAENNNVAYRGTNNWVTSGGTLSFSETGSGSYVEDFIESTQTFAVEGIRIEWEMRATVGTRLGYVGPYVLLTQSSGTGWNSIGIGAQVFYRWESAGTNGAVIHAGRSGNPVITSNPSVPGVNDNTFARHVVAVSNHVVTWTVNGQTMASADMGPVAPEITSMRLMIGARLYDSGVAQTIDIRNLAVTTQGASTSNDNFSNATTMSGSSGNASGSNVGATRETGEPSNGGSYSVWWKWTAPSSGTATIDTEGSDFDTYLAVYTGSSVSSLTMVAYNDDAGSGLRSLLTFAALNGTTYYVAVTGFGGATGNIRLNWQLAGATNATTTSFTWESWRQRAAENNNVAYRGTNSWVANGGTLSFSGTGSNSYIEDFVESTETFAVEGVRIEWEMQARVGTSLGYVGPYVLLTQTSGSGWNAASIGAQVFYRWESGGTNGAVLHAGRLGNPAIASNPVVPGVNDNTFARHVVTVSNGVVTWTVNGQTMSTADMGTAPYAPMRLMIGARLYDSGVSQTIEIRNLTVTAQTAAGIPSTTFTITNRGGVLLTTDGQGALVQGYTRIRPSSGNTTPSGVAILGLRQNNVLVSEAGVPASSPIQNGRIYAEVSASAALNTGIAVANPNSSDATISFQITNTSGQVVQSGSFVLGANKQRAAFLDGSPFFGPKPVQGALSFSSNVPVSVIALRTFVNERNDFLMTTLPVVDTSVPAATGTQVIPHFADGAGFTTHILLVNPGDSALSGTVQFFNQGSGSIPGVFDPGSGSVAGAPTNVSIGGQVGSSFAYSVAGRSSMKFSTAGTGSVMTQGSVRVFPTAGGSAPVPLVVFTYKQEAFTLSEAGVPAIQGSVFRLFVQAAGTLGAPGSMETGFAAANTSASPGTLTLELTNLDGSTTGLPAPVTRLLPGSGQVAGLLSSFFSNVPKPFRGVLRISTSTSGISVVGIRSRFNENGSYLMTTTPPTNESAPASSVDMMFPHIVNGGGFITEFIIFSGVAGQSTGGNLQFFRDDGNALNLTLN